MNKESYLERIINNYDELKKLESENERLRIVLNIAYKALKNLEPIDGIMLTDWWNQWGGDRALAEVEAALKKEARHG